MSTIMPEGENVQKAIKWISQILKKTKINRSRSWWKKLFLNLTCHRKMPNFYQDFSAIVKRKNKLRLFRLPLFLLKPEVR